MTKRLLIDDLPFSVKDKRKKQGLRELKIKIDNSLELFLISAYRKVENKTQDIIIVLAHRAGRFS